jgi:probable phosphoglycerate mutase
MIYLLRHGEIVQSRPRRFVGQRDLPLTAHGRAQAAWWRKELAGVEFAAIVASDLTRCRETAAMVANGRQVRLDPAWREISLGRWEGLTKQEVQRRYPGQWEARGANLALHQTPGGESFAQVAERALPALEALAALGGPVLVVAHAGVIRAALCRVLEMPLNNLLRLELDYAGLCLLEPGPRHWVLHGLNLRPGV